METVAKIEYHYGYIANTHAVTGVVAKFALGLVLYLVATGNENPGRRLLAAVIAAQLAISGLMAGFACWPIMLPALAAAVALGIDGLRKPGIAWRVLPEEGMGRWAALAAYGFLFWYPVWGRVPVASGWWASPLGALPHQTLGVLAVLCVVGAAAVPARTRRTAGVACAIIGGADLALTRWPMQGVPLLVAAAAILLVEVLGAQWGAHAPARVEANAGQEEAEEGDGGRKKWNLK